VHERLLNELTWRLASRALGIIGARLGEEEHRETFAKFYETFKKEVVLYEQKKERMDSRLRPAEKARQGLEKETASGAI
jgi:hypothetical protein